MALPADTHVHSEFSWDTGGPRSAAAGTMRRTCARAVRIGLPVVIFTEHLDLTGWGIDAEDCAPHQRQLIDDEGVLRPPPLDLAGYRDAIDRCRSEFGELRILTGVEFGQPHLDHHLVADRIGLDLAELDRVNGSLHTLTVDGVRHEPVTLYRRWPAERVITEYLAEVPRMMASGARFDVFTHIDYAVRAWPEEQLGPFDPRRFEEPFRAAMRAVAASGRALELNVGRLRPWIPQWWAEAGGRAVSFGSDAHVPEALARNFGEATAMAQACGFVPGRRPEDFWTR